jgi:DNA-binding CsgD family transcriptional regulator
VAGLVDRSLLQVGERDGRARYRMLESVRLYAQERLAEMDDPARMRDRHLDAFIDLAKRARDGLAGPEAEAWTARLAADLDDLRAAMDWAAESQRPLAVLDIAEPTSRFWFDRGLYGEMGQRLQAAVADPGATDIDRARGATTAALLAVGGGDLRTGYSLADRAVALTPATETSDARALGLGLRAYAGLISQLASYDQIRADVDEATLLAEGLGDSASRPHVLVFAGITEAYGGTLTASRRLLEHAVALCEDAEVLFHLPATHVVLGMWALFAGDLERCRTHIMQGSALGRRLRRSGWEAAGLAALAVADVVQGDERTAAARLAEARALTHGGGLTPFRLTVHRWTALVAYGSGDLVAARAAAVAARRTAHEWGSCWDEACAEWILGTLDSYEGRHADARARLERARELSVDPGYPFTLGRSLTGLAQLAQFDGDLLHAWELAHQSLEILAAYGDHIGVGDALETVAGLSAALGKPDQALRLLAAAKRFHADTGIGRFPLQADYYDRHVAAAQEQLSEDDATACWAEGASLTLMEAVAYVRRGRGERGRPETGWDSLTPAEHDLIRYVAEGCTNAQIGERLFISVNTVKKHLSRIYLKLGVEGRAELAAQVARRAS